LTDALEQTDLVDTAPAARGGSGVLSVLARYPAAIAGGVIVVVLVVAAIGAPWMGTVDPVAMSPTQRLKPPSALYWMGTDSFGRDVWSRVVYGTRVSLSVAFACAAISVLIGLFIGMIAGYFRLADAILMRIMDGLMSIPGILLAIALISLSGSTLTTVIVAISVPEIPRVVRLVRSVVLTVREEPYVQAAISVGTPLPQLLWRHVMPNTFPPLIVQATYVAASAMLTEAILSFLGAGTPPEFPSWGNMMAEGRVFFPIASWIVLFPGIALALSILAVNVVGDGLRDRLDPRMARKM
jgi:peptide/nickel transport system permease protein